MVCAAIATHESCKLIFSVLNEQAGLREISFASKVLLRRSYRIFDRLNTLDKLQLWLQSRLTVHFFFIFFFLTVHYSVDYDMYLMFCFITALNPVKFIRLEHSVMIVNSSLRGMIRFSDLRTFWARLSAMSPRSSHDRRRGVNEDRGHFGTLAGNALPCLREYIRNSSLFLGTCLISTSKDLFLRTSRRRRGPTAAHSSKVAIEKALHVWFSIPIKWFVSQFSQE